MKRIALFSLLCLFIAFGIFLGFTWDASSSMARTVWQQAVSPGALSQSHAYFSNQCATCHTPIKGVQASNCITCHADNSALLQRLPTVFHSNVQVCSGCHLEHQGGRRMPTTMDHTLLLEVGIKMDRSANFPMPLSAEGVKGAALPSTLLEHAAPRPAPALPPTSQPVAVVQKELGLPGGNRGLTATESRLSCAGCHATQDRHQGRFGAECAQCHTPTQWMIPQYRHPSPRSTECVQCHKEPPSHNMMHFSMMSARLADQPKAQVHQCFLCHQTTSWNDIKGKGWIKHH